MINEKFSELINKEIDGVITPLEKMQLDQYLHNNADAARLYNELTEASKILDKLPDAEPSEELKKRIMNSIDLKKYAKPEKRSFKEFFGSLLPSPKIAATFALGLTAGIIILAVLFKNPEILNSFQTDEVSGTIGLSDSHSVESIPVNTEGISGNIEILKGFDTQDPSALEMNHLQLNLNLKSSEKFLVKFRFNSDNGTIEDYSCSGPSVFSLENGTLNILSPDRQKSTFIVSFDNKIPDHMELSLLRNGQEIFKHNVLIEE